MEPEPVVIAVDDDPVLLRSLERLIKSAGLPVRAYASAEAFLADYDPDRPGCLVLDVRMPGMTGLELQEQLASSGISIPVIIITGHGDVSMAVRAMHLGAVDFLEKPYSDEDLLQRIRRALEKGAAAGRRRAHEAMVKERLQRLSPRERQAMELLVAGKTTKQIAAEFGVTTQTVDVHRARVLHKMEVENVVELVQLLHSVVMPGSRRRQSGISK